MSKSQTSPLSIPEISLLLPEISSVRLHQPTRFPGIGESLDLLKADDKGLVLEENGLGVLVSNKNCNAFVPYSSIKVIFYK